jgi:hypothetical protein
MIEFIIQALFHFDLAWEIERTALQYLQKKSSWQLPPDVKLEGM